jgi:anti-sigma-K factor RskA
MTDPRGEHRDCGADGATYALGALEPDEAEAFRRHLSTCVVCRDELAAFQALADMLPLTTTQMPVPRQLRRRLVSSARREPKATRAFAARRLRRGAPARPPAMAGAALVAGGALVAAAAVTVAFVLSSGGSGGGRLAGTRIVQASVATPSGSAVVRLTSGTAELLVRRFPPPPAGKIYEVWLQRAGRGPTPTNALFSVTSTGAGTVDIPGDVRQIDRVLVTPEPLGGSSTPTHSPVIVARLS